MYASTSGGEESDTAAEITSAEQQALLQRGRIQFQQLVDDHPYPVEEEPVPIETNESIPEGEGTESNNVDPLTAMMMEEQSKQERMQELDLKYRKERAMRRNRGVDTQRVIESEDYDETAVTLQIIDKDLARLPQEATSPTERIDVLRQILFIYHCTTTPSPGYRQGMHEIASFLLLALEMEKGGVLDEHAAADTYHLLCAVLKPLQPAFDVKEEMDKTPLVSLGKRIMQSTAMYHPALTQNLQQRLYIPPELFLTKWIRLLYGRELIKPFETVLDFWDFLFQSCRTYQKNLLAVLEAAAAARLLLHAPKILSEEDPQFFLMNLPAEGPKSIGPWKTVTAEILQAKVAPLSHVDTTLPPPPQPIINADAAPPPTNNNPIGNNLWNQSLTALVSSASTPNLNKSNDGQTEHQINPLFNSLSAGLKQTLESAKNKTQSISKRLAQEWEQHQQQQQQAHAEQQRNMINHQFSHQAQQGGYDVTYRRDGLYDPSVSPRRHSQTEVLGPDFQLQAAVIHNYLTYLEQEQGTAVPPEVWQAIADMRTVTANYNSRSVRDGAS